MHSASTSASTPFHWHYAWIDSAQPSFSIAAFTIFTACVTLPAVPEQKKAQWPQYEEEIFLGLQLRSLSANEVADILPTSDSGDALPRVTSTSHLKSTLFLLAVRRVTLKPWSRATRAAAATVTTRSKGCHKQCAGLPPPSSSVLFLFLPPT